MSNGPFCFSRIANSHTEEEGVKALFTASQVVGGIGSGPTEVVHGFIKDRRNAHGSDVSITEEFGDEFGITLVGFDDFVGFALSLGGSHEAAIDAKLAQSASKNESGGTSFITNLEVLEFLAEEFGYLTKGAFDSNVGAGAFPVIGGIFT